MKPSIIIDLDVYNNLIEFKEKIEQGKTLVKQSYFSSIDTYTYFYTDNEIIIDLIKENEQIKEQINNLKTKDFELYKIKNMSIFKFIKFRKIK